MGQAEHHAQGVDEICLAIAGAVIWKGDDIRVMQREGEMRNVLWVRVGWNRYAFTYSHTSCGIEVREGHSHGVIKACFSNVSTISEVKRFFRDL